MPGKKPATKFEQQEGEERLLVEAAQQDPSKFGDVYDVHFETVYAFIVRRVRDRDNAEDLTAEVFKRALANLRSFEWRGAPFGAWLIRIAANLVADQSKRAGREIAAQSAPEPRTDPDFEDAKDEGQLFRLVDRLPQDQKRVVYERFVEEKSIREIAEKMRRSEGAIKQLQFRALQSLREQMEGADA